MSGDEQDGVDDVVVEEPLLPSLPAAGVGTRGAPSYARIVVHIFERYYVPGGREVAFGREDIADSARALGIAVPKNLGDVLYSFRYRNALPDAITATAPAGYEWVIESVGRASHRFRLTKINRIVPNDALIKIKIPDATPEIVTRYAKGDEQALLARVRYNRLIDIFLGITSYSLQSHLRTSVRDVGQIEIDELYVGVNRNGVHFVVPVQAKGGGDQIGVVQTAQDVRFCSERYPSLVCRAVAAQFMVDGVIAMFELGLEDGAIVVVGEKHYKLVAASALSDAELARYAIYDGL